MPWYSVGSVSLTANSATVTGTGTAFSANARTGDAFRGPDGRWYEVTNITSATVLSIKPNYQGTTATGQAYALAPMQGYVKESADRLRQFVDQYGSTLASLGGWSTAATGDAALDALGLSATGKTVARGTAAQGRGALGLGSAATANVQTSPTDNTPGALMSVGAFGLGRESHPGSVYVTDANALTATGDYAVGATWTGSPTAGTAGANQGSLRHIANFQTTAYARQEWASLTVSPPTAMARNKINGVWTPWFPIFHAGNILGAVSQLNGVPTGALFQTVANANGRALIFPDGTAICSKIATASFAGNTAFLDTGILDWPVNFTSTNQCSVGHSVGTVPTGVAGASVGYCRVDKSASTIRGIVYAVGPGVFSSAHTMEVCFTAIGRVAI